jgi:type IV pilus assembly protein PilE
LTEEALMRTARGFTLVEVMIVLVILMILTTLAYPSYAGYITKTRRIEGMVALVETMQQQERYFMRNNSYVAFSAAEKDPGAPQFRAWSGASAARSAYEIAARACPGQAVGDCIELHATPGTAQVDRNFRDPDCGVLTLDSTGRRGASGTADNCWP